MEHIEEAGVHSGDSASVIPPQSLSKEKLEEIKATTRKLGDAIGVVGLLNVQYAIAHDRLYVLEANPRASRTVPYVSKATGVQVAKAAALIAAGSKIETLRSEGILPGFDVGVASGIAVKEAVLPWNRFRRVDGKNVDSVLGPEMKSTGEVMGIAPDFGTAFAKSQIAAFGALPTAGSVFISLSDKDKEGAIESARALSNLGFYLLATEGTRKRLLEEGISSTLVAKVSEKKSPTDSSAVELIEGGLIKLVVNTPFGRDSRNDGWLIRSSAVAKGVPCITTVAGLKAAVSGIKALKEKKIEVQSLQDWNRK